MSWVWVVCLVLWAGAPSAEELKAYQEAKAQAGRDAEAHIKLALWCEAHGMPAEREKHLGMALLIDPNNARARELLGLSGQKGKPEENVPPPPQPAHDEALAALLAEYNDRRERTPDTADAQWQLALWCEQNGLKAEAFAHLANVVRLDPSRDAAWKRMGFRKHHGRWMTDEQIAAERIEIEAQKKADRHWEPLLKKWKGWLGEKTKVEEAQKQLANVTDPRAVPSIWRVFGEGSDAEQRLATQMLGQIKAPGSSRMLAVLAISGKSDQVKRQALEVLRDRDPMEFVDLWISVIREPYEYELRPVGGPGSPGALYVKGERFNVQRLYAPPSALQTFQYFAGPNVFHPRLALQFASSRMPPPGSIMIGTAPDGTGLYWHDQFYNPPANIPAVRSTRDPSLAYQQFEAAVVQQVILLDWVIGESQKMAYGSYLQQQNDVAQIEAYNTSVKHTNARASEALASVTGQNLGEDREAWIKWWQSQRGSPTMPNPAGPKPPAQTVLVQVPLPYMPLFGPPIIVPGAGGGGPGWCLVYDHGRDAVRRTEWWFHASKCFAAGTPVQTPDGPRPIEMLQKGDAVIEGLSQEPRRVEAVGFGESPTLQLVLPGETLVATASHPFLTTQGWRSACSLRKGDSVLTAAGSTEILSIEPGPAQVVFNLRLEGGGSFLAGASCVVVRDGSPLER